MKPVIVDISEAQLDRTLMKALELQFQATMDYSTKKRCEILLGRVYRGIMERHKIENEQFEIYEDEPTDH
jgi:hypothetical protein